MTVSASTQNTAYMPTYSSVNEAAVKQASTDDRVDPSRAKRAVRREKVCPPIRKTDFQLLGDIKKHFREYATGANDEYVNFNELKEAAGQRPTTRTFSPEATAAAKELLDRPTILRQLDIGINFLGFDGAEDKRFDMDNLDYMLRRYSNQKPPTVWCKYKLVEG